MTILMWFWIMIQNSISPKDIIGPTKEDKPSVFHTLMIGQSGILKCDMLIKVFVCMLL